jgi:hypothetical protein
VGFDENVFINCPYDDAFYPLLRPMLFTVIYAGLTPRLALEQLNSGEPRFQKIIRLIEESKYAIHDISRIKAKKRGELFRFNMPFELGLDVGCRAFSSDHRSEKRCLILEAKRYRYQAALSDLSNSDIEAHKNKPTQVVIAVRNWLRTEVGVNIAGPTQVWTDFYQFMTDDYDDLSSKGFSNRDIQELPVSELVEHMSDWIRVHAVSGKPVGVSH